MSSIPDHPAIRRAELTGYGEPTYEATHECPHCGAELYPDDTIYKHGGEAVGCKFCFDEDDWNADEVEECEAEDMYG